jgi:hypothetical protein
VDCPTFLSTNCSCLGIVSYFNSKPWKESTCQSTCHERFIGVFFQNTRISLDYVVTLLDGGLIGGSVLFVAPDLVPNHFVV